MFVSIESISDKCQSHSTPLIGGVINPSQHYTRVELSLIETHFFCMPTPPLSIYYIGGQNGKGPGWSYTFLLAMCIWRNFAFRVFEGLEL